MPLSAEDRHDISINAMIEQERMFTILDRLYGANQEKALFVAEIEAALKECLRRLEEMEPS